MKKPSVNKNAGFDKSLFKEKYSSERNPKRDRINRSKIIFSQTSPLLVQSPEPCQSTYTARGVLQKSHLFRMS